MLKTLVIDDDLIALERCRLALKGGGFDVLTEVTARAGLAVALNQRVDAIVADLKLPDFSGLDILKRLQLEETSPPFIVLTAFASIESAVEAIRLGASDFLSKPVPDTDLVVIVQRAINGNEGLWDKAIRSEGRDDRALDPRVRICLRIIRERYADRTLRGCEVAKTIGISHFFLTRLMKQETGSGFLRHLHLTRVREGQRLLEVTLLSIKEIAHRIGYASTTRFDHHFYRICLMTPRQFRNQLQNRSQ